MPFPRNSTALRAILALAAALAAGAAPAQVAAPGALAPEVLPADLRGLEQQRAALLAEREALLGQIRPFNARCTGVRSDDAATIAACKADQAALLAEVKRYHDAIARFNELASRKAALGKERRAQCTAASQQAARDRRQIEKLRQTTEMSQEEIAEWTRLNGQAQAKAITAAVKFTLGEFTADLESTRGSVAKLERHAAYLAKKAQQSRKYKTRMQYAAQLEATLGQLEPKWGELMEKEIVKAGLDADKVWKLANNTMHHEFRVARRHNDSIREVLKDPAFREAFAGDDLDTPGLDALATLAQAAGEQAGKLELGLERYGKFTGPAVRAAVFVRDAAYAALLSGLSTERVLQQSDVAGDLARATASLQAQYKKSVDAVRACRQAGIGG